MNSGIAQMGLGCESSEMKLELKILSLEKLRVV